MYVNVKYKNPPTTPTIKLSNQKDIKAIPYLQKMVLQLPKAQKCEIKEIRSNDDFDKGIDNIIGFEEN